MKAMALLEKGDYFADKVLSVKIPEHQAAGQTSSWMLDQAIMIFQVFLRPLLDMLADIWRLI